MNIDERKRQVVTKKRNKRPIEFLYARTRALNNCCYKTTGTTLVESNSSIIRAFQRLDARSGGVDRIRQRANTHVIHLALERSRSFRCVGRFTV